MLRRLPVILATLLLISSVLWLIHAGAGSAPNVFFYEYGAHTCPHCEPLHRFLEAHFPGHHYFCDMASTPECTVYFRAWLEVMHLPPYIPQTIVIKDGKYVVAIVIGEVRDASFWLKLASLKPSRRIPVFSGTRRAGTLILPNMTVHEYIVRYLIYLPEDLRRSLQGAVPTTTVATPGETTTTTRYTTTTAVGHGMGAQNTSSTRVAASGATPPTLWQGKQGANLTPLLLVTLALTDSVNPCTIAIYALLLSTTVILRGRSRALVSGVLFILGVMTGYTLLGVSLLTGFSVISIPHIVLRIILVAYGTLILYRGLARGEKAECHICRPGECPSGQRIRRILDIEKFFAKSEPYHYLLGLLLSLTLLPCSAGPYLVFLMALSQTSMVRAVSYILAYNVIFVSPLVASLLLLVAGTKRIERIEYMKKMRNWIYVAAGATLILVGATIA